jgi:hypothetical protein
VSGRRSSRERRESPLRRWCYLASTVSVMALGLRQAAPGRATSSASRRAGRAGGEGEHQPRSS